MAIVLQHQHVCPLCEDTWRCTCWMCDREFDELPCNACKLTEQKGQTNVNDSHSDPENIVDKHLQGDIVLV
jgi:hypothetical protein